VLALIVGSSCKKYGLHTRVINIGDTVDPAPTMGILPMCRCASPIVNRKASIEIKSNKLFIFAQQSAGFEVFILTAMTKPD